MEPVLIPLERLLILLIPIALLLVIYARWSMKTGKPIYAIIRMMAQLLIIGYFLTYLFDLESLTPVLLVILFMLIVSSYIALNSIPTPSTKLFGFAFISLLIGSGSILILTTKGVLDLNPWYLPQYTIPLAGMIFANSMSSISLVAERYYAETERGVLYSEARNIAFQAAMIPSINALFAVGLVTLPGMMTGQVLAGIDPLIAARYQIMVMLMLLAATGFSSALFLWLLKPKIKKIQ